MFNIAAVVGSLRKESFNKKLMHALDKLNHPNIKFSILNIEEIPLFNQDNERPLPAKVAHFKNEITQADGVLFVTPEYNRSVPGVLKNAIDIGSRPYGQSVWDGKPGAIMSVSPSAMGGFGANHHLRQALVFLNIPILQQPEAYIGKAAELFNDKGEFVSEDTKKFAQKFMEAFDKWIKINSSFR